MLGDEPGRPTRARGPDPDARRERYEAALTRSGRIYAEHLARLEECNRSLVRLVEVRVGRPWTDVEYTAYLRLRRTRSDLNVQVRNAERAFEGARVRLRDFGQPF